jgi:hypothetical protein
MAKKTTAARKKPAPAKKGGPMTGCEAKIPRPVKGDYFFLVKIVPVNWGASTMKIIPTTLVTKHRTDPTTKGGPGLEVSIRPRPEREKASAFNFEVLDLNEKLDRLDLAECVLDSNEGQAWKTNALDWAIFKVTID